MKKLHEGSDAAEEERRKEAGEPYEEMERPELEKGDMPAMIIAAFITFIPVAILGANSDLPNLIQIEDVDVPLITENYHEFILDLKDKMPNNWSNIVAPSKISTSFDTTGKQVVMPFGIGIGVLFYREDLFKKAGINIEDIVTWEDYINAGKKLQSVLPNTKMIGMPYPQGFSAFIRAVMLQQNKDYFTKDGKIAIASKEAIEAGKLIQRLVLEGIAFDTTDWTGTIRACKTDDIASIPYGIWWGGTLKDQAPEMKGKWKVTYLPILKQGDIKTSIWGGASGAVVNVGDAVKQTAAVEFAKNAMLTVENQMLAYKSYGLIPTYLPTFDEDEFYEEDPYFGKGEIKGEKEIILKPQTYMNLSGICIKQFINYYKIEKEKLLIIYDDMDIEPGKIKIRKKGSSGGHNGIKSIIQEIGTEEFQRIRIGIGKPTEHQDKINYVIGKVQEQELVELEKGTEKAEQAVAEIIENGIDIAMNKFN